MSWDAPDWLARPEAAPTGEALDALDAQARSKLEAHRFSSETAAPPAAESVPESPAAAASVPRSPTSAPSAPGEDRSMAAASGEFIVSSSDGGAAASGEFNTAASGEFDTAAVSGEYEVSGVPAAMDGSSASGEFLAAPDPDGPTAAHVSGEYEAAELEGGSGLPPPPDSPAIAAAESGEYDAVPEIRGAGPEPLDIDVKVPTADGPDALSVEVRIPPVRMKRREDAPESGTPEPVPEVGTPQAVAPSPEVSSPSENEEDRSPEPGAPEAADPDTTPVEGGDGRPVLFIPALTRAQPEPEPVVEVEAEELDAAELEVAEVEEAEVGAAPAVAPVAPPKPPPARRRKHWCEDVFGDHFAALHRSAPRLSAERDIEFMLECLELEDGATVLDVGSGSGEHAMVMAGRGYKVTGLDNSLAQVLRASEQLTGAEGEPAFMHGDMRELPSDQTYDAVVCIGTTFGYFDEEQNRVVMEQLRDRLAPGGKLLIQVINRDHLVSRLPARSWWQGDGCLVLDEAEMNFFANRLRVHRTIVFEDGRQYEHYMFIRAFTLHDLGKLVSTCGLRVVEISGARETRGRFYGATSPDIWVLAERRTEEE